MIPKIIHYCWFSDDDYLPLVKRCIKSWKKYFPDYEIRLWDSHSFDFKSVPFVKEAFDNKQWAFVSDYIRLYALYHYGGVYLDSDVKVHGRIDDWHNLKFFTGIETRPPKFNEYWIEAAIMGSEPRNPMIRDAMKHYENTFFVDNNGSFNKTPAPDILTPIFIKHYKWERKPGTVSLGNRVYVFGHDLIANDSVNYKKGIKLHHRNNCSWFGKNNRGFLYNICRKYGWMPYYRRLEYLKNYFKK